MTTLTMDVLKSVVGTSERTTHWLGFNIRSFSKSAHPSLLQFEQEWDDRLAGSSDKPKNEVKNLQTELHAWLQIFESYKPAFGLDRGWHQQEVDAFSRALFYSELLRGLDPAHFQVNIDWKELIKIKQYLADSTTLTHGLKRRNRRAFAYWWYFSLETIRTFENKQKPTVDEAVRLTRWQKISVIYQSWFGRHTFK